MAKEVMRLTYINRKNSVGDPLKYEAIAGLDSLSRNYDAQWEAVTVYGRKDPIQTYKSTGDTISVSWPLINPSPEELSSLLQFGRQFTRPTYNLEGNIIEAPLLKLEFPVDSNGKLSAAPWLNVIIAPTSLSFDFGDRARLIAQTINRAIIASDGSSSPELKDVIVSSGAGMLPEKVLISLSGPVIKELSVDPPDTVNAAGNQILLPAGPTRAAAARKITGGGGGGGGAGLPIAGSSAANTGKPGFPGGPPLTPVRTEGSEP